MSFSSQSGFEFVATGGKAEIDSRTGKVDRVVIQTDSVATGVITYKPRKTKQEVRDGIPTETPDGEKYELENLPDNIKNVLRKSHERDELPCSATVTKYEAEDESESDAYFINSQHGETLEARLIVNQGDSDE